MKRVFRILSMISAVSSIAGTIHTIRNMGLLRIPHAASTSSSTPLVSILIPARNEELRITSTLESVLTQTYPNFEVIILDDASTDATSEVVQKIISHDSRFRLVQSHEKLPAGWLGKPWAAQRLGQLANGEILFFLDADVILEPDALDVCVSLMIDAELDVMCPYPSQTTTTFAQRIMQPLLHWSWLTTLPLDIAESSKRPSLTAGNGQILFITSEMYKKVNGHECVKSQVLEDINLVRQVKLHDGKGGVVDGTAVATCLMYNTNGEMIEGYTKSLWNAFGTRSGAVVTGLGLFLVYALPLFLLLSPDKKTRRRSGVAYLAAALGRVIIGKRMNHVVWPDAFLHPLSILGFNALTIRSLQLHQRNELTWKGRSIHAAPAKDAL